MTDTDDLVLFEGSVEDYWLRDDGDTVVTVVLAGDHIERFDDIGLDDERNNRVRVVAADPAPTDGVRQMMDDVAAEHARTWKPRPGFRPGPTDSAPTAMHTSTCDSGPNHPGPCDAADPAPTGRQGACPDDGTCHHQCTPGGRCWRVDNAAPLSGVYPGDRWPDPAPIGRYDPADDPVSTGRYNEHGRFVPYRDAADPAPTDPQDQA